MMAPDAYTKSSIPLALASMNTLLLPPKHHPREDFDMDHSVTINDQVLIRVTKTAGMGDAYSPTPEGIHQDHGEISGVILVGLRNATSGGESRLWNLSVPTGNYDEGQFESMKEHLIVEHRLNEPWESILFNDWDLKHEARSFSGRGSGSSMRDVIVNFLRKPLKDGTDVKLRQEKFVPV